jgi:hypothetical protein
MHTTQIITSPLPPVIKRKSESWGERICRPTCEKKWNQNSCYSIYYSRSTSLAEHKSTVVFNEHRKRRNIVWSLMWTSQHLKNALSRVVSCAKRKAKKHHHPAISHKLCCTILLWQVLPNLVKYWCHSVLEWCHWLGITNITQNKYTKSGFEK